jgi:hypothetical protein
MVALQQNVNDLFYNDIKWVPMAIQLWNKFVLFLHISAIIRQSGDLSKSQALYITVTN